MLHTESDIKIYHNKQSILLIITISIMISIVSIVTVARVSIKTKEIDSIPTTSANVIKFEDNGLNESEKRVLTKLSEWIEVPNNSLNKKNNTYIIYFNYLKEYLKSSGVDLSSNKCYEIEELIKNRNEIVFLEKESAVNKMSLDGREVAIHLLKQIYELSGLKLMINMEGDIEEIADLSDNTIYINNSQFKQSGFQFNALIITLTTILTLFVICLIIAKKNQFFVKDGKYDGFDEKEFA